MGRRGRGGTSPRGRRRRPRAPPTTAPTSAVGGARPTVGGGTIWIGIDDTDGPNGGCTTFALTEVVRAASELDVDLIGEPRLVRLNPNVPFKTRGNGALAARFGRGRGGRRVVGEVAGSWVHAYGRGDPLPADVRGEFIEAAWTAVVHASERGPGTEPALVASDRALPAELYWQAVSRMVPLTTAERTIADAKAEARTLGPRNGLVGAAAAIAWPGLHPTWELLAYRDPERIGLAREVDAASVQAVQDRYPSLFLCHDPRTRRLMVAPHTDCPILYGLRSTQVHVLRSASRRVRSEPVDRWLVFRTNQGTGDHLTDRAIASVGPFEAARIRAQVTLPPTSLRGGHVLLEVADRSGSALKAMVFEPTKTLPSIARALRPGDEVELWGGRGKDPVFRVEGIVVRRLARLPRLGPRPNCRQCGRSMDSLGRLRGYRCPVCRRREPPEARRLRPAMTRLRPGTYHPTPSARRHLAPRGPEPRASDGDL